MSVLFFEVSVTNLVIILTTVDRVLDPLVLEDILATREAPCLEELMMKDRLALLSMTQRRMRVTAMINLNMFPNNKFPDVKRPEKINQTMSSICISCRSVFTISSNNYITKTMTTTVPMTFNNESVLLLLRLDFLRRSLPSSSS